MVVSVFDVGRQRIFTGVTARAMTTVVTERDGLGECNVESQNTSNRHCYLCNLERMSQACALVIIREYKDLGLAGKTAK